MKRVNKIVLGVTIFLIAMLGMQYFSLSTIWSLFSTLHGPLFFLLIFIPLLSYFAMLLIERRRSSKSSKLLFLLVSIWVGFMFLLSWIVLIFRIINPLLDFGGKATGTVLLIICTALVLYSILNTRRIKITKINLSSPKISKTTKIVHLSDIHIGAINSKKFLSMIVRKTLSLKPDVVVITGDLIDEVSKPNPEMLTPLEKINVPMFFVTGNHDKGIEDVLKALPKFKIKTLSNSRADCKNGISISGIDYFVLHKDSAKAISKLHIDRKKYNILLNHTPSGVNEMVEKGFDLQLSGHTHKGQIFPFNFFVRLFFKHLSGLHKIEETHLYVSQGAGTGGPPMRLGTRSEITLFALSNKKK